MADLTGVAWRKSTFSNAGGNCVEVALLPNGGAAIRHSKRPDDGALTFTAPEWSAFLAGVRAGEFG